MPQVTVYVRQEDIEAWNNIGKKAEFLHNALRTADAYKSMPPTQREAVKQHIAAIPRPETPDRFSGPLCKVHGAPLDSRGKCLQKGCKYA